MIRQLTSLDAQFLAMESTTHTGHVGSVAVFDPSTAPGGEVTLTDLMRVIQERLHLLPPLTWRLAEVPLGLDRPYWIEDPDFDLSYHVREIALPRPGTDAQLAAQVARITSRHLDRAHPLWEFYLVQGLQDGRSAVMTKMHHAMIDGMSGAEIMSILFDVEPAGRELPPPPPDTGPPPAAPGALELLGRGLLSVPLQPVKALRTVPGVIAHIDVVPSIFGLPGAETVSRLASRLRALSPIGEDGEARVVERPRLRAAKTPFSGEISAHRRVAFGTMSLPAVKALKNAYGVTLNDIVVTLATSALREWLVAHDALPAEPLLAMIPVSVRTEDQMGTYGNRISLMIVPLATDEDDPVRRVERTHEALRAAKDRHKALPAKALQDITEFIPPAINARAARAALQIGAQAGRPLYNVVISNVPGPPIPLYLAGAELESYYPVSVITDGVGLNITVLSYRDRLDFGLVADREQMPDLPKVVAGLQRALRELEKAAPAAA